VRRYFIETYGCSLNFSDTEYMEGRLRDAGFVPAGSPETADVVVLNTCTVKDRTFFNFLSRLKYYDGLRKRHGKEGIPALVIAGCIPRANPGDPALEGRSTLGTDAIGEVAEVAEAALRSTVLRRIEPRKALPRLNQTLVRRHPAIEIVPISKGCLGECFYCQTRLARGRLASYPAGDIVRQIEGALKQGVREIWITSQDTGAWGIDAGSSLPVLLRQVLKIPGSFRVRLGMANPDHVFPLLPSLLEIFQDEKMYRFLHLPLQSGSDDVLKAMNRRYTVSRFLDICGAASSMFSDFSIATDVIVGYPGETDVDFEKTLDVIKEVRPSVVNRSRFSPRPHTRASLLPGLPSRVVRDRSRRLTRLIERISRENNRSFMGWRGTALIDMRKRGDSVIARNGSYKAIILPSPRDSGRGKSMLEPGMFREVEIVDFTTYHLVGKPIKKG